jgi:ABC-type multidrug transport system fused ATPase/permease subunit
MRLVRGDAACLGRVAELLNAAIVPAFACVLAAVTLFLLHPIPTLVIVALTAVSTIFLSRASMAAAESSRRLESLGPEASRQCQRRVSDLRDSPNVPATAPGVERWSIQPGGIREHLDARDDRMRAVRRSRLISNLFVALIMFIILVTLGLWLIHEGRGWGRLLVYLVAMQHGLMNYKTVAFMLTGINRFYPQLRRYTDFLQATDPARAMSAEPPTEAEMKARRPQLAGSLVRARVKRGSRVLALSGVVPNRYTAGAFIDTLFGPRRHNVGPILAALWFVNLRQTLDPERPLHENLGLPIGFTRTQCEAMLKGASIPRDWQEQWPDAMGEPVSIDVWQRLPRGLRVLLALAAAHNTDRTWIVVDDAALSALDPDLQSAALGLLGDRAVLVVSQDVHAAERIGAELVVIIDAGRIIGMGSPSWFNAHRETAAMLLQAELARGGVNDDAFGDDEEV